MQKLRAFLDDSREYPPGSDWCYHAIGGYVAPVSIWEERFEPRWRDLLSNAPRPLWEFKTSDCRVGAGEFQDWSTAQRQDFGLKVVQELCSEDYSELFGVAAVMRIPQSPNPGDLTTFEQFALEMCLIDVIQSICQYAHFHGNTSRIDFICDKQPSLQGRLRRTWNGGIRASAEEAYGISLSNLTFKDSHCNRPIQAADILVYEARKDVKSRWEEPERRRSKALEALCESRPHLGLYYDALLLKGVRDGKRVEPPIVFAANIPWLKGVSNRRLEDPRRRE